MSWCVTHDVEMYDSYTGDGVGIFYFCLKDGFERVKEVEGEGCPLDEYGLSMIAVSVNEDGGNDNIMSVEQLEDVIGMNFYKTFVPRSPEEIEAKKREVVGMIYSFFEDCYAYYGGIDEMVENDIITPLGEWFDKDEDEFDSPEEYGIAEHEFYENVGDMLFIYSQPDMNGDDGGGFIIVNGVGNLMYEDYFDNAWGGNGYSTVCVCR